MNLFWCVGSHVLSLQTKAQSCSPLWQWEPHPRFLFTGLFIYVIIQVQKAFTYFCYFFNELCIFSNIVIMVSMELVLYIGSDCERGFMILGTWSNAQPVMRCFTMSEHMTTTICTTNLMTYMLQVKNRGEFIWDFSDEKCWFHVKWVDI